ncbi:MAG: cell division protein FtsX [Longimicrobiales bacterium]
MIALSLFVAGLFGVVAYNIRQVIQRMESRVEIIAYLSDSATPVAIEDARTAIAALPEVDEILYISKPQALARAQAELGDLSPVFAELEGNPLPASLEVRLHPGQSSAAAVRAVAERIAEHPVIEEVSFGSDWLDKVFLLRRIAGAATFVLGGAFALVAALIIGSAIRMAIFARRDEIAIMRLVGATDEFVRRPYVIEGLIAGLIGALIALPLTYLTFAMLSGAVFRLEWMPTEWILAGLAAGALLGVISSSIAVRRHLREV